MTTEELLQKCVRKDRSAWDEFSRRYTTLVTRSVKYKLGKMGLYLAKADILDIVQDIFLAIWEKDKLSTLREASCLDNWLVITSLNATSNYCRKNGIFGPRKTLSLDDGALLDQIEAPPIKCGNMEFSELKNILDKEISKFGYRQALALKFHIYDGKKQKDIAKIMNVPAGTVATWIKRGKEKLRANLKDHLKN